MGYPVLWWWLALGLSGLAALPLTTTLFAHLPQRGYAWARLLGPLLLGYLMWLLAMLQIQPFGRVSALLSLGLLALAGYGLRVRTPQPARLPRSWSSILGWELLFGASFLAGLWLRRHGALGGAILGTEKPMELAFLAGIATSPTFPPLDPWLAGYSINYYYFGYVPLAALQVLTGSTLGETFNLGFATVVATSVTGTVALTTTLAAHTPSLQRWHHRALLAATAVVFLLILGNQGGLLQRLTHTPAAMALNGPELLQVLSQRAQAAPTYQLPGAPTAWDYGDLSTIVPTDTFSWWAPSRAVWDAYPTATGGSERRYAITEFPFFSLYLGDLHPHVLALPLSISVLGVLLALLHGPPEAPARSRQTIGLLGLLALLLGIVYMTNSWDLPLVLLLSAGVVGLGFAQLPPGARTWRGGMVLASGVLGTMLLAILPFLLTFRAPVGTAALAPALARIPVLRSVGRMVGVPTDHTSLLEFGVMFGAFFVILIPAILYHAAAYGWRTHTTSSVLVLGTGAGILLGIPLAGLLLLGGLAAWTAWAARTTPSRALALGMSAVAAWAIVLPDLVYLRDHFDSRMNTVFKFYYHAWILAALAAAYLLVDVLATARHRPLRWLWGGLVGCVVAGGLVYPFDTLRRGEPWRQPQSALDGLAYLAQDVPGEAAVIAWVQAQTAPGTLIITSPGTPAENSYQDGVGRIAAVTGRPTLVGWWGAHERLWRSASPTTLQVLDTRRQDVERLYTTTDRSEIQAILTKYTARYVYVGPLERRLYGDAVGERLTGVLEPVVTTPDAVLYRHGP